MGGPTHVPLKNVSHCTSLRTKWLTYSWAQCWPWSPTPLLAAFATFGPKSFSLTSTCLLPSKSCGTVEYSQCSLIWRAQAHSLSFLALPASMVLVILTLTPFIQTPDHLLSLFAKVASELLIFSWFFPQVQISLNLHYLSKLSFFVHSWGFQMALTFLGSKAQKLQEETDMHSWAAYC